MLGSLGAASARENSQLPQYVEMYLDGSIKVDEMVSFTMPLHDINKAFDYMHEGKSIRSVITF